MDFHLTHYRYRFLYHFTAITYQSAPAELNVEQKDQCAQCFEEFGFAAAFGILAEWLPENSMAFNKKNKARFLRLIKKNSKRLIADFPKHSGDLFTLLSFGSGFCPPLDEIVLVDVSSLLDLLKRTTIETADYEFNSHEGPSGPNSFPVSFLQLKVDLRNLEFYVIQPSSASDFVAPDVLPGDQGALAPFPNSFVAIGPNPSRCPRETFFNNAVSSRGPEQGYIERIFLVTS